METVECKIRVRYSEVGRQGFAHHSHYLNWFDIALEGLIKRFGMSYSEIEDVGYFLAPMVDQCRYIHPAQYNDELTVRLKVSDISSVKVKFLYEIFREKDAMLIAVGHTDHVFVDRNFKPQSLKKALPRLYEMLKNMI